MSTVEESTGDWELSVSSQEIARGGYGAVYEGTLGGRSVAVKRLHNVLIAPPDGELTRQDSYLLHQFQKECQMLKDIDHPHIVKFLGEFTDPRSREPLMAMERMAENLYDFLQRMKGRLSVQRQLEIAISVARGLRFLHGLKPPIVHRDLTDKNIMITQDGLVKIGDLGQSKIKADYAMYFTSMQPGAVMFMPPEALRDPPHYNEKVDIFSMGVVMGEIATQRPPSSNQFGIGYVPEVQRREKEINLISELHPLKPLVLNCLKDDYTQRPNAAQLYRKLLCALEEKDFVGTRPKTPECQELTSLDDYVTADEVRLEETKSITSANISPSQSNASNLYDNVESSPWEYPDVFQSQLLSESTSYKLCSNSTAIQRCPIPVSSANVVRLGDCLYLCGGYSKSAESDKLVQVYSLTHQKWSYLPPSPIYDSEVAIVDGFVTLIGGADSTTEKITNKLCSWIDDGNLWDYVFPPMTMERFRHAVLSYDGFLIACGGVYGDESSVLQSMEVMNLKTLQWTLCRHLCLPVTLMMHSMAICSNYIYISGGSTAYKPTKASNMTWRFSWSILRQVLLEEAEMSATTHPSTQCDSWERIADTPLFRSVMLKSSVDPIIVSGRDIEKFPYGLIYKYNSTLKHWKWVGQITEPRICAWVGEFNATSFIVGGGFSDTQNSKGTLKERIELVMII